MKRLTYGLVLILVILLAAAIGFAMVTDIKRFVADHKDALPAYTAAGDYFNVFYGLPLALGGAVLGAAATFIAGTIAARQGDVQILSFIEEKTKRSIALYREVVSEIGDLMACGNDARDLGAALYRQIELEGGPHVSPLAALLLSAPRDFHKPEVAKAYIEGIDNDAYRDLLAGSFWHVVSLRAALHNVAAIFDEVAGDLYAALFSREQAARTPKAMRPLAWLKTTLPAKALSHDVHLEEALPALSHNLKLAAGDSSLFAPARATALIADGAYTIEYLGLVLSPVFMTPKRPIARGDLMITRYMVNLGGAYLLSVIQALPEKKTVIAVFGRIFSNRSRVGLSFLETAMPHRRDLGPPFILDSIEPCLKTMNRLIMVDIVKGGVRDTVFYDPELHGPIPADGYEEFGEQPLQEHL
jgi:hypothetical protein